MKIYPKNGKKEIIVTNGFYRVFFYIQNYNKKNDTKKLQNFFLLKLSKTHERTKEQTDHQRSNNNLLPSHIIMSSVQSSMAHPELELGIKLLKNKYEELVSKARELADAEIINSETIRMHF